MPGCSKKNPVHQQITRITLEKLCKEFEDFPDLCELINDENKKILISHVCDPDKRKLADHVIVISKYCICDDKEVDIDKCNELMSRRRELEQRLSSASSLDERKSIEEELRNMPKCEERKSKPRQKPVKHHYPNGVNIRLWWYYVYTATKDCLKASCLDVDKSNGKKSEKIRKCRECIVRLARALHYAQDGAITKHIKIEDEHGIYMVRVGKLHDIFEEGVSEIIMRELSNFDIFTPIREGVNMALNERKEDMFNMSTMSKKLCLAKEVSITDAMKAMFRNTAYTLTKFIQIIRFVRREGKKIRQLYMLYKVLQVAGYATIASLILLVLVLPQTTVYVWLAVIGALLIALSKLLYSRINPMICLYMNVDCKNYIKKDILTKRSVKKTRKGIRTVIREYRVAL
jgi:hypothetical protein